MPLLVETFAPASPKSYADRVWKIFALAQTSRQIRAEFGPLWMRNTAIRFGSFWDLKQFIYIFMPNRADRKHLLKMFEITWEHRIEDHRKLHITPLLRVRSFCPQFYLALCPTN